jgi:hypothetical protein
VMLRDRLGLSPVLKTNAESVRPSATEVKQVEN